MDASVIGKDVVIGASELVAAAEAVERGGGLIWERHFARAPTLRGAELGVARERAANDDLPTDEVDVSPAQRHELSAAEASIGRDSH